MNFGRAAITFFSLWDLPVFDHTCDFGDVELTLGPK